jgi:hypothetical protein
MAHYRDTLRLTRGGRERWERRLDELWAWVRCAWPVGTESVVTARDLGQTLLLNQVRELGRELGVECPPEADRGATDAAQRARVAALTHERILAVEPERLRRAYCDMQRGTIWSGRRATNSSQAWLAARLARARRLRELEHAQHLRRRPGATAYWLTRAEMEAARPTDQELRDLPLQQLRRLASSVEARPRRRGDRRAVASLLLTCAGVATRELGAAYAMLVLTDEQREALIQPHMHPTLRQASRARPHSQPHTRLTPLQNLRSRRSRSSLHRIGPGESSPGPSARPAGRESVVPLSGGRSPQTPVACPSPLVNAPRGAAEGHPRGTPKRDAQEGHPRGTPKRDTQEGHPRGTPKRDTQEGRPRGTPKRDTQEGHPRGTPKRDTQEGHPRGTPKRDAQEGHPRGTPKRDTQEGHPRGTPKRDAQEGHPRGTPKRDTQEGHPRGTPKRDTQEGHPRGTPKRDTQEGPARKRTGNWERDITPTSKSLGPLP